MLCLSIDKCQIINNYLLYLKKKNEKRTTSKNE